MTGRHPEAPRGIRSRTGTRSACPPVILALVLMLSGCSRQGVELREDPGLSAQLQQLRRTGGTMPLQALAGGDWDRVHSFAEPVTRQLVQHTVGEPVHMAEIATGTGNVLVFEEHATVQRVILVSVPLFPGSYGGHARLVAEPPRTGRISLTDRDRSG